MTSKCRVGAVEGRGHHLGVGYAELVLDVLAHVRRRRGRGGQHRRAAEILERLAQGEVGRAEVVAPLRHAVGLVDHEARHADAAGALAQERAEVGVADALGGDQHQLAAGRAQKLLGLALLLDRERRIEPAHIDAALDHLVDLVFDERDQRRHHHGETLEDQRGELVEQRFAAARGHDGEDVLTGEDMAERLALAGAQVVDAEPLAADLDERLQGLGVGLPDRARRARGAPARFAALAAGLAARGAFSGLCRGRRRGFGRCRTLGRSAG